MKVPTSSRRHVFKGEYPETTADDCLRWYGLNATCERSGHVWLLKGKDSRHSGPLPLFVSASHSGKQYLSGYYGRVERRASWCLDQLKERGNKPVKVTINESETKTISLGETQLAAIQMATSEEASVITGGPGTGKTTIARIVAMAHLSTLGLSPTGKGADALGESLRITCYTIHRAIAQILSGSLDITLFDLIIVDETGMLDTETLGMLCRWLYQSKTKARVVFLGDPGQLPSVGPGKVLDELISCLPTTKLDIQYRYSDADIGVACESAKLGHLHEAQSKVYSINEGDIESAYASYQSLAKDCGTSETRLITIHRGGDRFVGAADFNRIARYRLPKRPPVVCIKNNYKENVFNGQCGYMNHDGSLQFGMRRVFPNRIQWVYGYGSTCNAAQGGQWRKVVVWVYSARYITREWLHTALSRAVDSLSVIVKDAAMTEACLASSKPASRRISLLGAFQRREAKWV